MHRSGTSALARIIAALGVYAGKPEELLPAHPVDNPNGYWERTDVMHAHDHCLEAAGYAWDRVAGFDPERLRAGIGGALRAHLTETIAALQAHGTPWLIKDPRLCLFLPVWLQLAGEAACIVAVRDPREIAASLLETHRGTYTSHFLLALWEKYTRTLLDGLQGRRALFVSYATLLSSPVAQYERLQKGLADLGVKGLALPAGEITELLDSRLRRSAPADHARLSSAQATLYRWLEEQTLADGPVMVSGYPRANAPDAELAEFERALDDRANRAREAAVGEINQHLAGIETRLHQHEHERSVWLAELAAHRAHQARMQEHETRLRESLDELRTDNQHLRDAIADNEVRITELDTQTAQLQNALETERRSAQAEWDAQVRRADELQKVLDAERHNAQVERDAQKQHADALTETIRALQTSLSWRITTPLRAIAQTPGWILAKAEHVLWRGYYAIPGTDAGRKRSLIVWLHIHAPWLTRRTLSYQIYTQTRNQAAAQNASAPGQRMDGERAAELLSEIGTMVRFSIVMLIGDANPPRVIAVAESMARQFYPAWELLVVAEGQGEPNRDDALADLSNRDPRIKVKYLKKPQGKAAACDKALQWTEGDYVVFLDDDVELARDALLEIARAVARDKADLIYSDEDTITREGRHIDPVFKPDFAPDYLLSTNFIGRFCAVRREVLQSLGGFRAEFERAQDYDLLLRISEATSRITHIPLVLYHRHADTSKDARAADKTQSELAALREALARRHIEADAEPGRLPETYRVRRRIADSPLVSILLPFRDKPELLRVAVNSVLAKTRYSNFELVGIDNGSADDETHALMRELAARDARVRFIRHDVPFNYSAIINFGVANTLGEHLLMLNNDTEIVNDEWMDALLEHSQRPEVGAVGALLLYPNKTIQHGGVIVGLGGVAGHAHLMLPSRAPGYLGRAQVIQDLSAVTFACAMTRRDVFEKVGGLDAVNLIAAYNDIDYCLRLREAGYLIVYTPFAELYHHESASRPHDLHPAQRARYDGEIRYMKERHAQILGRGDPYYNPQLSLCEGFLPSSDYVSTLPV